MFSQTEPVAEVFSKDGSEWRYKKLEGEATLNFSSLEFDLVVSSLYELLPPLEKAFGCLGKLTKQKLLE